MTAAIIIRVPIRKTIPPPPLTILTIIKFQTIFIPKKDTYCEKRDLYLQMQKILKMQVIVEYHCPLHARRTFKLMGQYFPRQLLKVNLGTRHLMPGKSSSTRWRGGWVGPTGSLDVLEKRKAFTPTRIQTPDCPVCCQVAILTPLVPENFKCQPQITNFIEIHFILFEHVNGWT